MEKPTLVVMAAGMGCRYNGTKQLDPVGSFGEIIMDYSLYDARRAGFRAAVLVVRKEIEAEIKKRMDRGAARFMDVATVRQDLERLPAGSIAPKGRRKPWGTGHAVLSVKDMIKGPFAVINADDYYGPESFKKIYDFLSQTKDGNFYEYGLVDFPIENTVTENGPVSRGLCEEDGGYLTKITEKTGIQIKDGKITGEGGEEIKKGTPASMNLFGFTESFMPELERIFKEELPNILEKDPLKGEFFLPTAVGRLIKEKKAKVKLLKTNDRWYGMTYREDKKTVKAALKKMTESGLYPKEGLWT